MMSRVWAVVLIAFAMLGATPTVAESTKTFATSLHRVRALTLVDGLFHPWSLAFLPDGRLLITERKGQLRIVGKDLTLSPPVAGLPEIVEHGQGGLLDVALHPDYARNGWIYWSYNAGSGGQFGTELARGKLAGTAEAPRMGEVEVLFRMKPKSGGRVHFGSRIVFDRAGYLYLTLGDRGDSPDKGVEQRAQKLDDHAGKTIRLQDDGRIPTDNPFVMRAGALPEIWSYGHRNLQGAARHPQSGEIWTHEHGPQGGDEINVLRPGANYGWPVVTYGTHYGSGAKIGEGTAKPGMLQPLWLWVPSIAPSGMVFYSGRRFPKWRGNLLVGALVQQLLIRLELDGDRIVGEERLFERELGRIRDVREGPDGLIYLLTDEDRGRLIRLEPAD